MDFGVNSTGVGDIHYSFAKTPNVSLQKQMVMQEIADNKKSVSAKREINKRNREKFEQEYLKFKQTARQALFENQQIKRSELLRYVTDHAGIPQYKAKQLILRFADEYHLYHLRDNYTDIRIKEAKKNYKRFEGLMNKYYQPGEEIKPILRRIEKELHLNIKTLYGTNYWGRWKQENASRVQP